MTGKEKALIVLAAFLRFSADLQWVKWSGKRHFPVYHLATPPCLHLYSVFIPNPTETKLYFKTEYNTNNLPASHLEKSALTKSILEKAYERAINQEKAHFQTQHQAACVDGYF